MAEAMVTEPSVRNPPTFEPVWVTLQELAVSQKETDRLMKEDRERQKETERILKGSAM